MTGGTAILVFVVYTAVVSGVFYGVLRLIGESTLVAAIGGAFAASLGVAFTALLTLVGDRRTTDERIRDEASRVALELTRMDYDLRREAVSDEVFTEVNAPVKVYRELYLAFEQLRTKGTWPKSIETLGLLNVAKIRNDRRPK
jgi:hypothetical protein